MVLKNIEMTAPVVPFVVERIRDVEPAIRKFVYANCMTQLGTFKIFSPADRQQILSWGLRDRDPAVQKACQQMISGCWIKECQGNLLEFLQQIQIGDYEILSNVLQSFFSAYPNLQLTFDGKHISHTFK